VATVLEVLARDDECQQLARTVPPRRRGRVGPRGPGRRPGRGPLAARRRAGRPGVDGADAAAELALLADDPDEYVRRRAVQSLARRGAPVAEAPRVREWTTASPALPWTRMNALWCLHHLGSPALAALLAEADRDPDPLVRDYATRVRAGTAR
jgi:HEAT repeat protein